MLFKFGGPLGEPTEPLVNQRPKILLKILVKTNEPLASPYTVPIPAPRGMAPEDEEFRAEKPAATAAGRLYPSARPKTPSDATQNAKVAAGPRLANEGAAKREPHQTQSHRWLEHSGQLAPPPAAGAGGRWC
jgi:hypothetical protein